MGIVFSGMTGGFLVAPFLAGIVYDNNGYFEVFTLVLAVLTFDFFLRAIIIEKKTAAKWLEAGSKPATTATTQERPKIGHYNVGYGNGNGHKATNDVAQTGGILQEESDAEPDETSPLICDISSSPQDNFSKAKSLFARLFPIMAVLLSSPRLDVAVYGCSTYMTIVASPDACLPLFVKRQFNRNSPGVGLIFLALTAPALLGTASFTKSPWSCFSSSLVSLFPALPLILALQRLMYRTGIGVNLILIPLVADMFYESGLLEKEHKDVFEKAGAYAQIYSLLCAALGFATAVGPAWSGLIYEMASWKVMMITRATICVLGSIGVIFYIGGPVEKNGTQDERPDVVCKSY